MICFQLRRDLSGNAWSGSSLEVTIGGDSETWVFDDEIGGPEASGQEVVDAFVLWFNHTDRAWHGAVEGNWDFQVAGGRVQAIITSTAMTTWAPSPGLAALMGWPASTIGPDLRPTGNVAGAVGALAAISHWQRHDEQSGIVSAVGSWRTAPQGVALRRPSVEVMLDEAGATALAEALRVASSPRRLHAYQLHPEGWRTLAVGPVDVTRNLQLYRATMEVLG